jgi:hypothetical protein
MSVAAYGFGVIDSFGSISGVFSFGSIPGRPSRPFNIPPFFSDSI